jgi:hypothetical protein
MATMVAKVDYWSNSHRACRCGVVVCVQRLGVSPRSLAQLVSETFNEMIFIHGDVHCDPHAANMVRTGSCVSLGPASSWGALSAPGQP